MSKGYVNKETRILADNVNAPHIYDEGGVTDTVSKHIVDIIDDHKEEIRAVIGGVINYSANETETGVKWLNGETIYQKTLTVNLGGRAEILDDSINSNNAQLIGANLNSLIMPSPYPEGTIFSGAGYVATGTGFRVWIDTSAVYANIDNWQHTNQATAIVTIQYIKK